MGGHSIYYSPLNRRFLLPSHHTYPFWVTKDLHVTRSSGQSSVWLALALCNTGSA